MDILDSVPVPFVKGTWSANVGYWSSITLNSFFLKLLGFGFGFFYQKKMVPPPSAKTNPRNCFQDQTYVAPTLHIILNKSRHHVIILAIYVYTKVQCQRIGLISAVGFGFDFLTYLEFLQKMSWW